MPINLLNILQEWVDENFSSKDLPTLIWYHATSMENAKAIVKNGIKLSGRGLGHGAFWVSMRPEKSFGETLFKIKLIEESFSIVASGRALGEEPFEIKNCQAVYYPSPSSKWLAIKDMSIIKSIHRLK